MTEPAYDFSIPSIHDDTVLDCRIYHPQEIADVIKSETPSPKGAIIAHPYAPLGGSYDDPVVLSVSKCLLELGYVVITFNFRGAGESKGKTSWTGKPEVDDMASIVGLLIYYLNHLKPPKDSDMLSPVISTSQPHFDPTSPFDDPSSPPAGHTLDILLTGYSFGSLILTRLPSLPTIIQRFHTAERGTAASEILLRALTLAKQTRQIHQHLSPSTPQTPRGRTLHPTDSPTKQPHPPRSSPITVGGEETPASDRRRSRDSRRSSDIIREMPQNIKSHIHPHRLPSGSRAARKSGESPHPSGGGSRGGPTSSKVRYLLISPVLFPLTSTMMSPGIPFTSGNTREAETGVLSLSYSTLVVFGSADGFTASRKLRQWAERLGQESGGRRVMWAQIEHAGHFWREKGAMEGLRKRIVAWLMGREEPV